MCRDRSNANAKKKPFYKSPALRLSLSLSTILLLYRLLFRFLTRLRVHLLDPQVEPFRMRNPRTAATLTSPYAPAVGASLAGLALGIYPSEKMRVSIAIYTIFRALEFAYNLCESEGFIWGRSNGVKRDRPWWFGSWMLQPLAFGQLLHAAVFDRDCFPKVRFISEIRKNDVLTDVALWRLYLQELIGLSPPAPAGLASRSQVASDVSNRRQPGSDGALELAVCDGNLHRRDNN